MSSLKSILARVGQEKERVRRSRGGLPIDGDWAKRIEQSLDLYQELLPLRLSRLVSELGSAEAASEQLRSEQERREREQEAALLRIQARLYGRSE